MTAMEHYLALRPSWVPIHELTTTFRVNERELRSMAGKPGLCSRFAISGNQGYKHVRHATEEEFQAFKERLRSHGLAELERVSHLEKARNEHAAITASDLEANRSFDKSGQGLLLS
jgi:hypothetical protein